MGGAAIVEAAISGIEMEVAQGLEHAVIFASVLGVLVFLHKPGELGLHGCDRHAGRETDKELVGGVDGEPCVPVILFEATGLHGRPGYKGAEVKIGVILYVPYDASDCSLDGVVEDKRFA